MIKIRSLNADEITLLQNFPPEEWRFDLPKFVSFHLSFPYFYSIVAECNKKLAGFGNGIFLGKTCWIGNIIVPTEFRRQGIGHKLTVHLVEYFKNRGCISQLLIASEMGKNIYMRIGFRIISEYYVFEANNFTDEKEYKNIRAVKPEDISSLKNLDLKAAAEERFPFIQRFLSSALVYERSSKFGGFYLPDLGGGFIAAENREAGLELLKYRLSRSSVNAVVPAENKIAVDFLLSKGFKIERILPRMVLGEDVPWKPELIFNRGAGYIG